MKKIIIAGLLMFFAGFNSFASETNYKIIFSELDEKRVFVEVDLILRDSVLRMSPHGPMPERWNDYVENFQAFDAAGDPIEFTKNGNEWLINAQLNKRVKLRYELSVTHDEIEWPGGVDGVAFVKDWGYFLSGRSLFVYNEDNTDKIQVQFAEEQLDKIQVPWQKKSNVYLIDDHDLLTESFILYGDYGVERISKDNLEINFVLGGNKVQENSAEYSRIAESVMEYYFEMMEGSPFPNKEQSTLIMATINEDNQTDGEVIGSHISMLINPEAGSQDQLVAWFMFAHEFFHLWNGKTLKVESTRDDWFKEGITNYYTLKALYQIGFINEQAMAGIFNGLFYQRYKNDTGFGEMSMRDAAEGFSKDNHWGLIYGGGLFAGIALDMIIREETQNEKSLDDLMRFMYQNYAEEDQFYSTQDILEKASELANKDLSSFFSEYIDGSTPIPIEKYLIKAGFNVNVEGGQIMIQSKNKMTELQSEILKGFYGRNQ